MIPYILEMAQKTIVIGEGTSNVDIVQTIVQPETTIPEGVEVGGVSLTTGYGWGVDVGIILIILGLMYVAKKYVDKWIK
jgi:hypothetical protein